ncbi:hypothetical protein CERSUDRAFT_139649 [Gelatoporia subvermispora B]|uniref:Uncharacterized protein n=1 Tax=Ceriporiopsis subvermispora (strain B) TaxID=914234 RepID=M2R8A9_CERS8|nr:hypothetical protein CERSUDRAFT_139649 [Gelatoporia subvermispora B]
MAHQILKIFATILVSAWLFALPAALAAVLGVRETPLEPSPVLLHGRQAPAATPVFPSDIPSCQQCAPNYANIDSCAQAAPVLANFTTIIFNPGAFISIIECACGDTFQSAYPQCVDCFEKTNQTSFLNSSEANLPGIITGIRNICALESTLLGGAASADGEVTPTSSAAAPTASSNGSSQDVEMSLVHILLVLLLGFGSLLAL